MKQIKVHYLLIKQLINVRYFMRSQKIQQKVKILLSSNIKNQVINLKKSFTVDNNHILTDNNK